MKASISDGGADPVFGQDYILTCGIIGAENLNPSMTYQWTKDIGGNRTQIRTNFNSTSFSPLRLSDAGQYTCHIIVESPYIYNTTIVTASHNVTLESKLIENCPKFNIIVTYCLLLQSWLHCK